jgi:hypothetical protein
MEHDQGGKWQARRCPDRRLHDYMGRMTTRRLGSSPMLSL